LKKFNKKQMHNNFKNIEKIVFGRGSFNQMGDIIDPIRERNDKFFVFVVDNYFKGKELADRIPARLEDVVYFIDVDPKEPTTEQVDNLRDEVMSSKGLPSGIVGIGGGSIMDIAKATSLMFTNEGTSAL
jgi:3-deoxy-alpha-D-manno-octulosonate 8-oxidase